jgi:TIR domain-containing protein
MTASAERFRGVFISYRRRDAAFPAGWLYEQLAAHFGRPSVFKDIDSIQPGEDFLEVITEKVTSSDAILVVIGPSWLSGGDGRSERWIDATDDVVRIEIETALRHGIPLIPVLVLGAAMPKPSDLPASIAALARRNALEITPNHFARDLCCLIARLERLRQAPADPRPAADDPTTGDSAPQPASHLARVSNDHGFVP